MGQQDRTLDPNAVWLQEPIVVLGSELFPFDPVLLQEILDRVRRLGWAERRWLIRRIEAGIEAGDAR